ncbi:TPR repeat-containing protein [Methanocaldococcus infernus ME]|uniref:TPR repeat-containing protein n=1 Tax=Methanocaldococcus infernus (strain DSM 11812 / JCM 15783 / ME) TaxID=573063 RepID=D5VTC0_METIM|nr:tetratricopeptide repeat protein [Methanocaldococcus infernus]ADG13823.1 TPR repeat-containing protein [Methanocaldococcus infernus ME]
MGENIQILVKKYIKKEEYEKVLELIEDELKNKWDEKLLYLKYEILIELKRFDEAIEVLDELMRKSGNYKYLSIVKGLLLMIIGKLEDSKKTFKEVCHITRMNYLVAATMLAYIYARLGEYEKSLKLLEKISEHYNSPAAYLERGKVLYNLGRLEESLTCFKKCLEKCDCDTEALYYAGDVCVKLGKYDEAIEYLCKIIKINPCNIRALTKISKVLITIGKITKAKEFLEKALELNPKDPALYILYGIVLNKLGKYDKAIEYFDKALSINPNLVEAWNGKGLALEKLGRLEEALECYNRAFSLLE